MKFFARLTTLLITFLFCMSAFAGFGAYQGTTALGLYNYIVCSTGLTCTKQNNGKLNIVSSPTITGTSLSLSSTLTVGGASTFTGGIVDSGGAHTHWMGWKPPTLTSGTSVTGAATTVYLSQVFIEANATLTGIKINNAATVGTNKYIVALFNQAGTAVANSNLAGVTTAGASAYQAIPFTSTASVVGPGMYWIGVYINGTTDTFYTVPAVGEFGGFTGSNTGQTFGTVAAITPPTSFTAGVGPVAFTY
jgi:hypothetical protein